MTKNQPKPYQWLAWIGTAMLLIATIFASLNIYPLYAILFTVANLIWTLVGILWKEKTLIVLNSGLVMIYIIGLCI